MVSLRPAEVRGASGLSGQVNRNVRAVRLIRVAHRSDVAQFEPPGRRELCADRCLDVLLAVFGHEGSFRTSHGAAAMANIIYYTTYAKECQYL